MRVRAEEVAVLRGHARAFAVGDARVGVEGRAFAAQRQLRGLLARDLPGMEQVQVRLFAERRHVLGLGQPRHRVLRREARDVVGRLHGTLDGGPREVGGARVAALAADIDRDAQRLVAVALHGFEFALAHRDAQAAAFGSLGAGVGGAQLACVVEGEVDEFLEIGALVAEAGSVLRGCSVHGGL